MSDRSWFSDFSSGIDIRDALFRLALVACALFGGALAAAEPSPDERELARLFDQRFYAQAEKFCRDRLASSALTDRRRADLTVDLVRALAEHAAESPAKERPALWQQASEAAASFVSGSARNPRLPLVEFQAALATLAEGELARQEPELSDDAATALDDARRSLRRAVAQWKALDESLPALVQRRDRSRAKDDELTAAELTALADAVRYQLARAYRNQALCYPPATDDRAGALAQAGQLLRQLAKLTDDQPLAWQSRLDEAICLRLLTDYDAARQRLAALDQNKAPAAVRPRIVAERIRLAIDSRRIEQAVALIEQAGRGAANPASADLDFAVLEAHVAAWRSAVRLGNAAQAELHQRAAGVQARTIAERHSPHWQARAERLLADTVAATSQTDDYEALARAAAGYYRAGKTPQAVDAYLRAAELARKELRGNRAFELHLAAAAILHERKFYRQASEQYRALSLAMPDQAQAAETHLMGAYDAGQAARSGDGAALARYEKLLEEHRAKWPESPTASQAAWWLARVLHDRRDWLSAIRAYRAVPLDHKHGAAAVAAMGQCYDRRLAELVAAQQPSDELLREAHAELGKLYLDERGRVKPQLTPPQFEALVAAARLLLHAPQPDYERAARIMTATVAGIDGVAAASLATARSLQLVALAGTGQVRQADEVLQQLGAASPDAWLDALAGLRRVGQSASDVAKRDLAELQLRTIEQFTSRARELSAADRALLDRLRAEVLLDAGRRQEALVAWQSLAKENPRDGHAQETVASLLMQSKDTSELKQAIARWREIEDKCQSGSPRWFRAQYSLAQIHFNLGHKSQARAIIKLAEASHPELGGAELKSRFLKLLAECEREAAR